MTYFFIFIFGLICGSFVSALTWRIRTRNESNRKLDKSFRITTGRSMCPNCHHQLTARDLVPVLSWLSLRGKCRYCQASISWQYPVIELTTAFLMVLSYSFWPEIQTFLDALVLAFWLVCLVLFMALAVYDFRLKELPNGLTLTLTIVALASVVASAYQQASWQALITALFGGLLLFGLFWLIFQFFGDQYIGGGDVKLVFALGLLAGSPIRAILLLFISAIAGLAAGLPAALSHKRIDIKMPYGPYLLLAGIIVELFGSPIINWYEAWLVF